MSKNSILQKIQSIEFEFLREKSRFFRIFKCQIYLDNLNFCAKKVQINHFCIFFTIFWRENSNSDRSFRNKLFFGTKIQIHDFVHFF